MIQLQNIDLAFGGQVILDRLTWTIKPKQRIGLIGPNGAGKSTLLRVIDGRQQQDGGTVAMSGDTTIGYLEQDVQELSGERSVVEEAMEAFVHVLGLEAEEKAIQQQMETATDHESEAYHQLLHRFEHVHTQLVAHEAHLIRPKTEAVLTGLGFDADDLDRPINSFSGGWRMRVALARLLLRQPNFLLLDEPTNHLDIDSIDWLEGYLKSYPGTVIIVSHDRYFLDRMVTTTAELIGGHLTVYAGNYQFYLTERAERRALQQAAYENQQKQIAETERFIERFRYKATKAKQVQSRVKMLEKLDRIPPPPNEQATIGFRFPEPERSGRTVLELSTFSKTYHTDEGDVEVFDDAPPLAIERGDKIALIGRNGAGKSTLARILNGTEPFEGTCDLGYRVEMTFFAQHQAESLPQDATILEALSMHARGQTETEIRSLLGAFLFRGDDVFKPIHVLSGGERSRVALARTLLAPANFLILDEPTNHLDIQSINVLIEALRQYSGSFIIVSHDRHFLDHVVNKVWRVEDGTVRSYLGSYTEYRWQVEHGTASRLEDEPAKKAETADTSDAGSGSSGPKTKEQKRREAEARKKRQVKAKREGDFSALNDYKLKQKHQEIEAKVLELEEQKDTYEAQLADPEIFQDVPRYKNMMRAYEDVQAELEKVYETWEAIAEAVAERELA